MSVNDRIRVLKSRHAAIDDTLHQEETRPHPDDARVRDLKAQKLRLKDEIRELEP